MHIVHKVHRCIKNTEILHREFKKNESMANTRQYRHQHCSIKITSSL